MGDHRISLSIKAKFHGKTYEIKDAWWNYNGHDGVDSRVTEFFENMWADGYGRYQDEIYEDEREQREKKTKEDELKELARLKAKYADNP